MAALKTDFRDGPPLLRYGAALLLCLLALWITLTVPTLREHRAVDFFYTAIFATAWLFGTGPTLLAAAAAMAMIDYFLLPPYFQFSAAFADGIRLLVFAAVALVSSSLGARLQKETLEREVLEITTREQERLGQDLHDGLCQTIAGARLLTETLQDRLSIQAPAEAAAAGRIDGALQEALQQAETIARGLHPVELDGRGLPAALEALAERVSAAYDIRCRFRGDLLEVEGTALTNNLYRLAQEAVMNAVKGGRAGRIWIHVFSRAGAPRLVVADDGKGMPAVLPRQGMGMRIQQHRARAIGADLRWRSAEGRGTVFQCTWGHTS